MLVHVLMQYPSYPISSCLISCSLVYPSTSHQQVHDPVCYKLLYQKLRQEEEEAAHKRREREIMDREKKAEM